LRTSPPPPLEWFLFPPLVAAILIVSGTTGRGDGLAMNIAGGAAAVRTQALEYGITPDEVSQAARGTAGSFGGRVSAGCNMATAQAASALATRGVSNPNMVFNARNPDGRGNWVGSHGASAMGAIHYHLCQANDSE